jgi:hypothetical protein
MFKRPSMMNMRKKLKARRMRKLIKWTIENVGQWT